MLISHVWLNQFRNLTEQTVYLTPATMVAGVNNQGKTNFLDAIYFGLTGTSFRSTKVDQVISLNQSHACVGIQWHQSERDYSFFRKVSLNTKSILEMSAKSASPLPPIGVAFWTDDIIRLFQESPDARRSALDRFYALLNPDYTQSLSQYRVLLKKRNMALKNKNNPFLIAIQDSFIQSAHSVVTHRVAALQQLGELLNQCLGGLSHFPITHFDMTYLPKRLSLTNYKADLLQFLHDRSDLELVLGYTTHGPHCDDYSIIDVPTGHSLLTHFSRGINRCVAIAFESIVWQTSRQVGIGLLDDVFSEIAIDLRRDMLQHVARIFSQLVVVSTLSEDRHLIPFNRHLWVENGGICEINC